MSNRIIRYIIPQKVRVRKFEVDIEKLKQTLKYHKKISGYSNRQIAEILGQPKTLVDHWFRYDNSFSIPNEELWIELKEILKIKTNEFDKSIMTFEIRDGVYDKANRIYDTNGIAPTLTTASAENERYVVYNKEEIDINKIITLGNYSPSKHNASRIISTDGIAPTVMENHGTVTAILEINNKEGENMNKLIQIGLLQGKYEQSNRIYSDDGVSPTIMAGSRKSCTGGYIAPKIAISTNGLNQLGFINSNKQGNRVYDEECSPTLRAIGGGLSGSSGLHLIENNIKTKGEMQMWKNKLEKFKFNMDEIKLFDSFAGKGALHKALKKLGVPTKVIGLSEIEPDAIIAYAGVHIKDFINLEFDYPSDEIMRKELMDINVGWDFTKQKSSILRMKKDKLKLLYKANKLTNNFGDISILDYPNLPDFDLFNFSFPCTDISNAGKQKGLKNEDGSHTRSGLVKFGIDLIKAKKPKYIMIENVKGLIQKKFINDFYSIVNEIESYGYKCHYATKEDKKLGLKPICLNAKDYGIPQNRERIFVICMRKDIDIDFEFPQGFDKGIRLKDILEEGVDEKYYLSQQIQDRFKLNGKQDLNHNELNVVGSSAPKCRTIGQRDMTYGINGVMSTLTATDYKQPKQIVDNDIIKIGDIPKEILNDNERQRRVYSIDGVSPTVLARTDNAKISKSKTNFKIRKLTPLECWRLMGFDDKDFYNAKALGLSDSSLYKLAGNSIVVNCLYYIFKEVFKKYIVE